MSAALDTSELLCVGVAQPLWDYVLDPILNETPTARISRLRAGKSHCDLCPAQARCLSYALHHPVTGLWGGVLFNERHQAVPLLSRHTRLKGDDHAA